MTDLIAAEFLKLRTTRTMWGLLAATVAVSALAVSSAVIVATDTSLNLETGDSVRSILAVATNGGLFVLVLGVIISAGEYRQGTAIETFLTTPRRWRVTTSKVGVSVAIGVVFGALSAGVSILMAAGMYGANGLVFPLDSSDAWSTLAGTVIYATLFAAIGTATGSLVRNQVAAIVGWLAWFAVVEHIAGGFAPDLGKWLPFAAGRALVGANEDLLSPLVAGVVLAGYTIAIAGAAVVIEKYRDA